MGFIHSDSPRNILLNMLHFVSQPKNEFESKWIHTCFQTKLKAIGNPKGPWRRPCPNVVLYDLTSNASHSQLSPLRCTPSPPPTGRPCPHLHPRTQPPVPSPRVIFVFSANPDWKGSDGLKARVRCRCFFPRGGVPMFADQFQASSPWRRLCLCEKISPSFKPTIRHFPRG